MCPEKPTTLALTNIPNCDNKDDVYTSLTPVNETPPYEPMLPLAPTIQAAMASTSDSSTPKCENQQMKVPLDLKKTSNRPAELKRQEMFCYDKVFDNADCASSRSARVRRDNTSLMVIASSCRTAKIT